MCLGDREVNGYNETVNDGGNVSEGREHDNGLKECDSMTKTA